MLRITIKIMNTSWEIALWWMSQDTYDNKPIGSGNGLVPCGNQRLSEPMLTQIYVIIWCN